MAAASRLSTALARRTREAARRRRDRVLNLESLEPRLALATGPLGTLVSVVVDANTNLLAASSANLAADVTEGSSLTASVALVRRPEAPVRVSFASSGPLEIGVGTNQSGGHGGRAGVLAPPPLVFTPSNWNIPQTLSIRSLEDGVADGTRTLPVRMTVSTAGRAAATKAIWVASRDSGLFSPTIAASGTFRGTLDSLNKLKPSPDSTGTVTATYGGNKGTATFRVSSARLVNVRDRVISVDYVIDSANKVVVRAVRGFNPLGVSLNLAYRVGSNGVPGLSGTLNLVQPTRGKTDAFTVTAPLVAPGMPGVETYGYGPSTATQANVGGSPEDIAIGADGTAWVANPATNSVQRLVRKAGIWTVADTVSVGNKAKRITVAPDGSAWVMNADDQTIQQIGLQSGVWTANAPVPVAANPSAIVAATDGGVWVASATAHVVQRIAFVDGVPAVVATFPVGIGPTALAQAKDGAIWVASKTANTVQRIAFVRGVWQVGPPIAVGTSPASISAAADGSIWVANTGSNSIQRIVQRGSAWKAQSPVNVGRAVADVTAHHEGSVWVTHATGGTIQRFVAARNGWSAQNPILTCPSFAGDSTVPPKAVAPDGTLLVGDPQAGTVTAVSALPSEVQNLAVAPTGVGSLLLSWNPPAGGATSYTVTMTATTTSYVSGTLTTTTNTTTSTTTATSMPFTGLSATVPSYTFTVTATNAAGSGPAATTVFVAQGPIITVGDGPSDLTIGQDGSIWVSNQGGNSVQQIVNTAGGWIAQPAIAVGVSPAGLATAQDGSIWVANSGSNTVQQITNIGGTWIAQPAITVGSGPAKLLAAADGSIWVSNYGLYQQSPVTAHPNRSTDTYSWSDYYGTGNTIQQIVNSGGVWAAQAPLNVGAGPYALASGVDGSIWVSYAPATLNFTEDNEFGGLGTWPFAGLINLLSRYLPSSASYGNTVQQFVNSGGSWTAQPAITVGNLPLGLTASSDGSIWVTNTLGNSIQQIKNGSGGWSAQPAVGLILDGFSSNPLAITAGLNGSLWVTAPGVTDLQEFSMVGGVPVSQPAVAVGGYPDQIVTGVDGSIWISAPNTNTVQQFRVAPLAPPNLSATSGSIPGEMTLAWAVPPDGGAPIVGYTVTAYQGTTSQTITTSSTSCTFSGLTTGQGTTYFTVTASNFVGTSPAAGLLLGPDGNPIPTANTGVGIVTDGTPFTGGGFDGNGYAYSWQALGSSPTLAWNGVTFDLGSPNQPNSTVANGQTIPVPQGAYTTLNLAGAAVNGSQQNQQLTLTFTDNSTVVWTQSFSDWGSPQNYGHEAIVSTQTYRDTASGGTQQFTNRIYGYSYTIPAGKTLASITLPTNQNVRLLDIQMSTATSVDLSSAYTSWGIANGSTQVANKQGFDGGGYYYYSGNLGPLVAWSGATFNFGTVPTSSKGGNNFVQAKGQTIGLPQGNYGWLYLAAAGANGSQQNQKLTLTFSDGSTATWTQSFSDWCSPSSFSGETIIQQQPNWVNQVGKVHSQTNYVYGYGYQIPEGKTLVSVTLPNNTNNLGILGIAMM